MSEVTDLVSNLDEDDEQTEDNLDLIATVYDSVEDLIDSGNFFVTTNVSIHTLAL